MQAHESRPVSWAGVVLGGLGLIAVLVLGWYAARLQGEVTVLKEAQARSVQRVELMEKSLQSVVAEQAELSQRVETQILALEGLEKRVRSLEEQVEELAQRLNSGRDDRPQLG